MALMKAGGIIGGVVSAFKGAWRALVPATIAGVGTEMATNQDGKGGWLSQWWRGGSQAASQEISSTQAIDSLFDSISAANNGITTFFAGTLAQICEFAAYLGFEPAIGWAEKLRGFEQHSQAVINTRVNAAREQGTGTLEDIRGEDADGPGAPSNDLDGVDPTIAATTAALTAGTAYMGWRGGANDRAIKAAQVEEAQAKAAEAKAKAEAARNANSGSTNPDVADADGKATPVDTPEGRAHGPEVHSKTPKFGKGIIGFFTGLGVTLGLTQVAKATTPDDAEISTSELDAVAATSDGISVTDALYDNLPEPAAMLTDAAAASFVPYYDTLNTTLDNNGIFDETGNLDHEVVEAAAIETGGLTGMLAGAWAGAALSAPSGPGAFVGGALGATFGYFAGEEAVKAALNPELIVSTVELNPEQQAFFDVYDQLPTTVTAGMPPEVQSLVELKANIVEAEANWNNSWGTSDKAALEDIMSQAQTMYEAQFDALVSTGGAEHVVAYLAENPAQNTIVAANEPGLEVPNPMSYFNPNSGGAGISGMNANDTRFVKTVNGLEVAMP